MWVTYLEAAVAVLKQSRTAMTTEEITDAAVRNGSIRPAGKTPAASMSAALYRHVQGEGPSVLQREFQPGEMRAIRGSVRWRYVG
jgi:hypothetical protein